ncbi:MAG: crossover junction endodeoxyribonuclease RuvC [Dehalococcoidia bacterium]|nr:crossover junction endodeoxyribonuclease RuvC [Dehalococcoidia bacterium]
MRILGVDPGTLVMGYGVLEEIGDQPRMVSCGVLTTTSTAPIAERLRELYLGLVDVIVRFCPDEIAIEDPFVARNARSALAIGRAQAIAMLAAASHNRPVATYPPAKVKQGVADYGRSDKGQVQRMVCIQLGLSRVPGPSDATDALAVALCHLREKQLSRLLAKSE